MSRARVKELLTEFSYRGNEHHAANRYLLGDIKLILLVLTGLSVLHLFIK